MRSAERAGPGMHHQDRPADAEFRQRLVDHPALDFRRRVLEAGARAPAVAGTIDQDHAMMFAPAARRAAAASPPDWSSRHAASRSADRRHRAGRCRRRGARHPPPRSSGPGRDKRAARNKHPACVTSARNASAATTMTGTIENVRMIFCTNELRLWAVRVSGIGRSDGIKSGVGQARESCPQAGPPCG